jgi:hypothetical protein
MKNEKLETIEKRRILPNGRDVWVARVEAAAGNSRPSNGIVFPPYPFTPNPWCRIRERVFRPHRNMNSAPLVTQNQHCQSRLSLGYFAL